MESGSFSAAQGDKDAVIPVKKSFHIPSLDGWRCVAVALVVFAHAGYPFFCGFLGVTFFFVISGFLITTLLRRELEKKGKIDFKGFYTRRVFRILPPMYALLIVSVICVATGVFPGKFELPNMLSQFLHMTNYGQIAGFRNLPGTIPMWSLAVEEHFYLFWPSVFLFLMSLNKPKLAWRIILGACVGVLVWRWAIPYTGIPGNSEIHRYVSTDTRIDGMLWGCALAMFANPYFERERAEKIGKPWLAAVGLVVILISIVLSLKFRETKNTFNITLQILGFVPLLMASMLHPEKFVFRILNVKFTTWAGSISYGIYLYHMIVVSALERYVPSLPTPLLLVSTVALTLGVATLSMKFMEAPLVKFGRSIKYGKKEIQPSPTQ